VLLGEWGSFTYSTNSIVRSRHLRWPEPRPERDRRLPRL